MSIKDTIRQAAVHMNGHLICAVDTETSGTTVGKHDIIQIAVLPLKPDYTVSKIFPPFTALIKPKRPQNVDPELPPKIRQKFVQACADGIDPWTCVDRFTEWFYNLRLPERKILVPLGHNYGSFDLPFITEWLGGPKSYSEFFRSDFRDSMLAALYINDASDCHNVRIPFPKVQLGYMAQQLGCPKFDAHDAIADAYTSALVYSKLMRFYDHFKTFGSVTLEQRDAVTSQNPEQSSGNNAELKSE